MDDIVYDDSQYRDVLSGLKSGELDGSEFTTIFAMSKLPYQKPYPVAKREGEKPLSPRDSNYLWRDKDTKELEVGPEPKNKVSGDAKVVCFVFPDAKSPGQNVHLYAVRGSAAGKEFRVDIAPWISTRQLLRRASARRTYVGDALEQARKPPRFHMGILSYAGSAFDLMRRHMIKCAEDSGSGYRVSRVLIYGHSLGAACALIAAHLMRLFLTSSAPQPEIVAALEAASVPQDDRQELQQIERTLTPDWNPQSGGNEDDADEDVQTLSVAMDAYNVLSIAEERLADCDAKCPSKDEAISKVILEARDDQIAHYNFDDEPTEDYAVYENEAFAETSKFDNPLFQDGGAKLRVIDDDELSSPMFFGANIKIFAGVLSAPGYSNRYTDISLPSHMMDEEFAVKNYTNYSDMIIFNNIAKMCRYKYPLVHRDSAEESDLCDGVSEWCEGNYWKTGTWNPITKLARAAFMHSNFVVGGKLYVSPEADPKKKADKMRASREMLDQITNRTPLKNGVPV